MQRIFLPPEQIDGAAGRIVGGDHNHLARVMRARIGDAIIVLDGKGRAYSARVAQIGKTETTVTIDRELDPPAEPSIYVTVAQALGKGDKFEQVVQHATEVGACSFVPIRAERGIVDIPVDRIAERLTRWTLIAKSAAEQSLRGRAPSVVRPISFASLLQYCRDRNEPLLLLHPSARSVPLRDALGRLESAPARITIAIGPEGGWSTSEVSAADTPNVTAVSLGPWVVRTETAALAAVSRLLDYFEEY